MSTKKRRPSDRVPGPLSWTVQGVTGGGKDHVHIPIQAMTLLHPDGREMAIGRRTQPDAVDVRIHRVLAAEKLVFVHCPLCLDAEPTTDEDVPPQSIGGKVMTSTCGTCNNLAGTRTEEDFIAWWHDAIIRARFTSNFVPGSRVVFKMYLRETPDGAPVFIIADNRHDEAIPGMLDHGGEMTLTYSPPDPQRCLLAALKSAYLGACLIARQIPHTPEAQAVREVLRAARDTPKNERVSLDGLPFTMWMARSEGPIIPGQIDLVQVHQPGEAPEYAVSLGGALLVSWPIGGYLIGTDRQSGRLQWAERLGTAAA